jgi:hypothetical protein
MHHIKGYDGINKDVVSPYCLSCHRKIHINARKNNLCNKSVDNIEKLSTKSAIRRYVNKLEKITFSESLIKNIRFIEQIIYNKNTGSVYYNSGFYESKKTKYFYIN